MTFQNNEINKGYTKRIKALGTEGASWSTETIFRKIARRLLLWSRDLLRLALLPFLLIYGLVLAVGLWLYKSLKRGRLSPLHKEGLKYISEFILQYPMHLYPVIAKTLELAFLKDHIGQYSKNTIAEVAIGDGTLSRRIFQANARVVGLDLNPYSLVKTNRFNHISQRVVCDCLEPPLALGAFDLLVANNFLHHVTDKRTALFNFSQIARHAVFNENTTFWSNGWTIPYLLSHLGLSGAAARIADRLEIHHLQSLEPEENIDKSVSQYYLVEKRASYFDVTTFFLCSIFSILMRCYGPPTPPLLKRIFLGPMKPITIPFTKRLAELLIYFDSQRSRNNDAFISYVTKSRNFAKSPSADIFVCPECGRKVKENHCLSCGRTYTTMDGMLFLLPERLGHVADSYNSSMAAKIPDEHL
jgi:hypothetical protein